MLKEVHVKQVKVLTEKDGKQYIDKNGNPFAIVLIENEEGNTASMYAQLERDSKKIKTVQDMEGTKALLDFEKKGEYLNFNLPSKSVLLEKRVEILEERVNKLEGKVEKPQDEDVDPDDLPF